MFLKNKKTRYILFVLLVVLVLLIFQNVRAAEIPPSSQVQWEDPWCPGYNNCGQGGCYRDWGVNHCLLYNCGTLTPRGQEDITALTDYSDYSYNYTKEMYENWGCNQRNVPIESLEDPSLLRKTCEQTDPGRPETYGYNCWTGKCAVDKNLATGSGISGAECMGSAVCGHQPRYTRRSLRENQAVVECTINYNSDLTPYVAKNVCRIDSINAYGDSCIEEANERSDTCFFSSTVNRRVDWPKNMTVGTVRETPCEPRYSHVVAGNGISWSNAEYFKDYKRADRNGNPNTYQPNDRGWFDVDPDSDFWVISSDREQTSNNVLNPELYVLWGNDHDRIRTVCESKGVTPPEEHLPPGVTDSNGFINWVRAQTGGAIVYKLLIVPYDCWISRNIIFNNNSAIPPENPPGRTSISLHIEWPVYGDVSDAGMSYGIRDYLGNWIIPRSGWADLRRADSLPCGCYTSAEGTIGSPCLMGEQACQPGNHFYSGFGSVRATGDINLIPGNIGDLGRFNGHCGSYDGWAADVNFDGIPDSAYYVDSNGLSGDAKFLDYNVRNLNNCADV